MPVLQNTAPYDSVETVLNFVRLILADYVQNSSNLAGDIFADSQPYALPYVNLGWRRMQRKMALAGHSRLEVTTVIEGLPVVNAAAVADPATQVYINWTEFFDGVAIVANAPVLPQDLIFPIKIGERQSGTVMSFRPMHPATDGLPSRPPGSWMQWWEWRGKLGGQAEGLYMRGSVLNLDLEIRYAAYMPDIVAAQGGLSETPVPFMRCAEALAYFTAAAYVSPREGGAMKSAEYDTAGEKALAEILALPAKQIQQRANYRRIPAIRSGRGLRWGRYR